MRSSDRTFDELLAANTRAFEYLKASSQRKFEKHADRMLVQSLAIGALLGACLLALVLAIMEA